MLYQHQYFGFYPAKILSYSSSDRTCMVAIEPFTRGSIDGIQAKIAYPIGHNDFDTEIQITVGMEVYVFFEAGLLSAPVVAFCRSHGMGAVQGIRRIRQNTIELIADTVNIKATTLNVTGDTNINGHTVIDKNITAHQKMSISKGIESTGDIKSHGDIIAGSTSLKSHKHGGVRSGGSETTAPTS